jgi:hypothetical protein
MRLDALTDPMLGLLGSALGFLLWEQERKREVLIYSFRWRLNRKVPASLLTDLAPAGK